MPLIESARNDVVYERGYQSFSIKCLSLSNVSHQGSKAPDTVLMCWESDSQRQTRPPGTQSLTATA